MSFLKNKLGEQVFADNIRIYEEPHRMRGLGSAPFDDEGLPTRAGDLVTGGVVNTWLLNMSSSRQLKMEPRGTPRARSRGRQAWEPAT